MTTRTLVILSSAIEAVTGVALIAAPSLVIRLLLGAALPSDGIAVSRVAGLGLLSLGLGCWPRGDEAAVQPTRALFIYNLFAALYLGYLRIGGGFSGYLLWPAAAIHACLALLFVRPAYATFSRGLLTDQSGSPRQR